MNEPRSSYQHTVTVSLCSCNLAITVCEQATVLQVPHSSTRHHSDFFPALIVWITRCHVGTRYHLEPIRRIVERF